MKGTSVIINCNGDEYEVLVSDDRRMLTQLVIVRKYRIDINENKPKPFFVFDYLNYNREQLENIAMNIIRQKKNSYCAGVEANQKLIKNALGIVEQKNVEGLA